MQFSEWVGLDWSWTVLFFFPVNFSPVILLKTKIWSKLSSDLLFTWTTNCGLAKGTDDGPDEDATDGCTARTTVQYLHHGRASDVVRLLPELELPLDRWAESNGDPPWTKGSIRISKTVARHGWRFLSRIPQADVGWCAICPGTGYWFYWEGSIWLRLDTYQPVTWHSWCFCSYWLNQKADVLFCPTLPRKVFQWFKNWKIGVHRALYSGRIIDGNSGAPPEANGAWRIVVLLFVSTQVQKVYWKYSGEIPGEFAPW